jgi:hypothetical protein
LDAQGNPLRRVPARLGIGRPPRGVLLLFVTVDIIGGTFPWLWFVVLFVTGE